jgi:hypothetical protein
MIRSLVLFVHITGVLTMCAGLALEAFGVESAGRATPRISGIAVALTVLSGFYLGARFGVLGDEWMRASYAAIVVMAAAGALARRSDALRRISLRVRAAFGLAVVFRPSGPRHLVDRRCVIFPARCGIFPNQQSAHARPTITAEP